jgi:hypothetical protein
MNRRMKLFGVALAVSLFAACGSEVSAPAQPEVVRANIQSVTGSNSQTPTMIPVDTVRVTGRGRTRYAMGAN